MGRHQRNTSKLVGNRLRRAAMRSGAQKRSSHGVLGHRGDRSIRVQKRKRQTNTATQAMIANTTAVVNALPLPLAFRACSISVIEFSRLSCANAAHLTRAKTRRSYYWLRCDAGH